MFSKPNQKEEIKKMATKIKELFKLKNSKRQDLANSKGKLLIENQIIEEFKRKIEENYEMYKDQIREMEENVDNKEEYIKMFEKKLREVEIYVQKNTKNLIGTKYDIYKDFIMNDFINENTDFLKKKDILEQERIDYIKQVEEAKEENLILKMNKKSKEDYDLDDFLEIKDNDYVVKTEQKKNSIVLNNKINGNFPMDKTSGIIFYLL